MLIGWVMSEYGPDTFWLVIVTLMSAVALYGSYRMTQRVSLYAEEAVDYEPVPYAPVTAAGTATLGEVALDYYAEGDADDDPDFDADETGDSEPKDEGLL